MAVVSACSSSRLPLVCCSILWIRTGYLVILWVTSRTHSGMLSLRTILLLISLCQKHTGRKYYDGPDGGAAGSYYREVWKEEPENISYRYY